MNQPGVNTFDTSAAGRAASAGGARVAGGVSNQARVAAWVGAHVVAGTHLPLLSTSGAIEAVGVETALAVDDVAALADDGGVIVIQAKGGLQLRREPSSDLGGAARQIVRQYREGVPTPDGVRPVEPDRDALAIIGDGGSSQQIRRLARVCSRIRSLPDGIQYETAARTKAEASALHCLLEHLQREWRSVLGSPPTEADLRAVLRCLVVAVLDLVGGEAIAAAKADLRSVLLDPTEDEAAWSDLVEAGRALAEGQAWARRSDLVLRLSVDVGPDRRLAADVRRLTEVTQANLEIMSEHERLPVGQTHPMAHRAEVAELVAADGSFVLTGDPGCGKTGVMAVIAQRLFAEGHDVVVLAVDTLGGAAGAARLELGLNHDLDRVLKGWSGRGEGTLMLDGLDAARGAATTWLRRLCLSLAGTRWRVVASVRQFDLRHSREWQRIFVGEPLGPTPAHVHPQLRGVRHYLLGPFSDEDLAQLQSQSTEVGGLLSDAQPRLVEVLRVPFNLRIACELIQSGVNLASLATAHNQLGLLERYWHVRVSDPMDRIDRQRVLLRACRAMLALRRLRIDVGVLEDAPGPAVDELLHDGVLVETPALLGRGGIGPLSFSHHILFDFAVAALVLKAAGESQLMSALDEDPNLVLIARPSIDFHLAELWHADPSRMAFAEVLMGLADSEHVLAGVAGGRACAAEVRVEADVGWLVGHPVSESRTRAAVVLGWICGAFDAADDALSAHLRIHIAVWAAVAREVAAILENQFDDRLAQQLFRLLWQLQALQPLAPSAARSGDVDRARATATLMSMAVEQAADRGWLAERAAILLPGAVAVDPSHASVVRATLAPPVMEAWRPEVYRQLTEAIDLVAAGDADAAVDVFVAVWRFEPTRDDITPMSTGVLTLTSTLRQDAEHVKWLTGEKFEALASIAGPLRSLSVLTAAVETHRRDHAHALDYPVTFGGAAGCVAYMADDLQYGSGSGAAEKLATIFVNLVVNAPAGELSDILAATTAGISHPDVWRRLLRAGAEHPESLGLALLPILSSGGLFAHPDTRSAAASLVAATAPAFDEATYAVVEAGVLAGAALLSESPAARDRMLDQLVGVLPTEQITDPSLAGRRAALDAAGGSPSIPEPRGAEAFWEPTTLEDYLGSEQVGKLDAEERRMADDIRTAESAVRNSAEPDAIERLREALRRIFGSSQGIPGPGHPLFGIVVSACEVLAHKASLLPDTDLGAVTVDTLLAAASLDAEDPA